MLVDLKKQKREPLSLKKRFRLSEFLAEKIITSIAFLSLAFIALIFVFVFRETYPIFLEHKFAASANQTTVGESETYGEEAAAPESKNTMESVVTPEAIENGVAASNIFSTDWQPVSQQPKYGIWPLIAGSFKVTFVAILIALPMGVLAALYTSTFAAKWAKELMKPAIEILAGFPSVVIGFFALIVLASLCQKIFGYEYRLNAFIGGLALSLAVIPIIYTLSEDALSAVPKVLTEASLALGATRWETAFFVVLPAATPGIFAASLLGVGRAFGETMIVLMATGNAALLSFHLFEPVRTVSATIGAEMAEVVFGDTHYHVLFLLGLMLFVFSFALNAIAEFLIRQKLMKKFKGL